VILEVMAIERATMFPSLMDFTASTPRASSERCEIVFDVYFVLTLLDVDLTETARFVSFDI
jgi:hypothetical protein